MRRLAPYLLLLFGLLYCGLAAAHGKEYPMLHYTIEDGLPSNMIYDIYQDKDGFVWIGTDKGVARYNGVKFETFTTADGLADNESFYFQPDLYGRLWIGNFNGDLCYYQNGVFHNASNTPFLKTNIKASITAEININRDSTINIFFRDNPGFIEIKNEKIQYFLPEERNTLTGLWDIIHIKKTDDGNYLLYYDHEMRLYNPKMKLLKRTIYAGYTVRGYVKDFKGGYFITVDNRLLSDSMQFFSLRQQQRISKNIIYEIRVGDDEMVCTNRGVFLGNYQLLKNSAVHAILHDRQNEYWMGTAKDGIYKMSGSFYATNQWTNSYKDPVIFAESNKDQFFFATNTRNLYRIKKDDTNAAVCVFNYSKSIPFSNDPQSGHWIENGSYFSFSSTRNYRVDNIFSDGPYPVKKINAGNLWGISSVYLTDSFIYWRTRRFIAVARHAPLIQHQDSVAVEQKSIALSTEMIYGVNLDRKKTLWFSTLKSIYSMKGDELNRQPQFDSVAFRDFVFYKNCMIGNDHHNQLLITRNYLAAKPIFDTIKSIDCVWNKFYKLNDSTFLISTNNYFRILELNNSKQGITYSIRLLENNYVPFQPDYYYNDQTTSYFFKSGSIICLPIRFILRKTELPKLKFVSLSTNKAKYFINNVIELSYGESKNIKVIFTPISFHNKNLSYEYSISPAGKNEDNWILINGEELNLFKLGFGTFIVRVRAKTMSGEYTMPASFMLSIAKPYWATLWFLGACLLASVLIIAYASRLGVKRSLKKKESEVRFLRSEYKALNALMNPHFIFNSLNSVQSLVNNNENATASKYIRIFSDLIRQNMRNIAQELISLSKEINLVENYIRIEQLRFKERLNYSIEIDENVETELIMIPPLLIQPLVENAIKHGIWPKKAKDGFVKISISEKGNNLYVSIEDNGVGLKASAKSDTMHESYAMTNIHKRIEQLSQIHQTKITISIEEIKDGNGVVSGVRSLVIMHMDNDQGLS